MIVINGDCLEVLNKMPVGVVRAMFADVPDNIGLKYGRYEDNLPMDIYYKWIRLLILEVLPRCRLFWLSYNPIHDLEFSWIIRDVLKYRHPTWSFNKFIWRYTFSQYNDRDCAYGYRPIIRLMRNGDEMNVSAIRELSERQLLGDKRAAGPRVPDNVWSIPRVTGNSWEREPRVPTQHPVALMERIIKLSIKPGEWYVDLFGGSGSSLRGPGLDEGLKKGIVVVEMDPDYCNYMVSKFADGTVGYVRFDDSFDWQKSIVEG